MDSCSVVCDPAESLQDMVHQYNQDLSAILELHAPLKTRTLKLRPQVPWYNDSIRDAKRACRRAERKWKKSRLMGDLDEFKRMKRYWHRQIFQAKTDYYSRQITECQDSKQLFGVVDRLLHRKGTLTLPDSSSPQALADRFNQYFIDKIESIRSTLTDEEHGQLPDLQPSVAAPSLLQFEPATEEEIKKIISSSPTKSSGRDPIPTTILKQNIDVLVPAITTIVNRSLADGHVPVELKGAAVLPLLKKANLDKEVLKSYRPVSQLPFLSKVLERVVAARLEDHMTRHYLHEPLQSAYRRHHSTETVLLRITNDILRDLDNRKGVILVLLDLSSAFDTIDYTILLSRLKEQIGIGGVALDWIQSYLTDRWQ